MIDLETLGLKPGCKILSIGACVFDAWYALAGTEQYYDKIEHTQQTLSVDLKTWDWWATQSEVAKKEAFEGKKDIITVLKDFTGWLQLAGMTSSVVHVWGNAASFDIKILEAAYNHYHIPVPWSYKNEECYRTLKNRFKDHVPEEPFQGTKHNALHDAIHQGKHCAKILTYIRNSLSHE